MLLALATGCAGFAWATVTTHAAGAPILSRPGTYEVVGRVVAVEPRPQGERLLLDTVSLSRVPPEAAPARVRVNLRRGGAGLRPGDRVRVRARLMPPASPALPGGFDYARQAWFEGLGAVGYALGAPERLGRGADGGWRERVADLRATIAKRMTEAVPGPAGAMSAALIAGVRAGIDQTTWEAMQLSGLAHLISISGLHMVLVAGCIFALARWLLALWPWLALRWPAQKPAAIIAIAGAGFYLLLSGATVPSQRSFLMVAASLAAILLNRNPLSLRLLAWAALAVLLLRPDAVVGASFQLSFAAVLALIVVHEALGERLRPRDEAPPGIARQLARYGAGVMATTVIASCATAPLTAIHFQTIATYGVLANLIAVPLTSFVVMPAGLLALPLMPLGLEWPLLWVMGLGVEGVLWTARVTAALPGASVPVALWPAAALPLLAAGGLWLALWRERWRWLGLAPVALAVLLAALHDPPDLLVDRTLGMAALRRADGPPLLLSWKSDGLVRDGWRRALGAGELVKGPKPGSAADGVACDAHGCVVRLGGARVSLARTPEAAFEDCGEVELVIARFSQARCPGRGAMLGSRALWRSEGIAVRRSGDGLAIETVAASRGDWPWSRPPPAGR